MGGLRAFGAELTGTFALTLAGAGAACMDAMTGGRLGPAGVAFAYAAAMAAAFYIFPGSGARFNPALTIADLAARRQTVPRGVFAVAAQLLGAACAGLLLRAVLAGGKPELLVAPTFLGACAPRGIGYRAATLIEAVLTFFLACAVAASQERRRRALGPFAIGAAALFGGLAAGPLTGAAMNPARAFGPAIAAGAWSRHYVYWVGPVAGALLAALLAPSIVAEENRP
ncbi:MAG TPA: aquaporin [Elusimicrobiota bacterium]|jgi:MIP family channel proteins|nr:aquaporin [Elusimicrobiota bacterium]